jgi:hypothetical protein
LNYFFNKRKLNLISIHNVWNMIFSISRVYCPDSVIFALTRIEASSKNHQVFLCKRSEMPGGAPFGAPPAFVFLLRVLGGTLDEAWTGERALFIALSPQKGYTHDTTDRPIQNNV